MAATGTAPGRTVTQTMTHPVYAHCRFLQSAHTLAQLPDDNGIEIAFAGRSNAGKSSALNAITQSKALVRVSRTPGRTQLINYFQIDEQRCLVDLPGYGYAKVPEKMRRHWQTTLQDYFARRRSLGGLMLVMDIRHPLQALDWQMVEWCTRANLKLHILLTKADKLTRNAANTTLLQIQRELEQANIEASLQTFSAHNKSGVEDAQSVLDEWFGFPAVHEIPAGESRKR